MAKNKDTDLLTKAVTDVWKTAGVNTDSVSKELADYWQAVTDLGPVDAARTGDASQKAWDWSNRLLDKIPARLKTSLKKWQSDASVSLSGKEWKPS